MQRNGPSWPTQGGASLQRVARAESLIDCGEFNKELAEDTGLPAFNLETDPGRAEIRRLLVLIAERDWADGGNDYILTSLVKLADENYPGKLYTLATQKDRYDPVDEPELDFWQRQVRLAHQAHRRTRAGRNTTRPSQPLPFWNRDQS